MTAKRKQHISDPTEDSIALKFEAENRHRFRFNATRGVWCFWNGHVWQPDATGRVREAIRQLCRRLGTPRMHTAAAVRGVEILCRTSLAFACRQSDFDRNSFLLGTPGGTVDLKTGRLSPATPNAMISRSTTVAPRAGEPTRWLQFLHEVTGGDAGLVQFLRQIAGHSLTGDTREHVLFFFYGEGGTGKSTYVNTLQRILGSYARTAPMATFTATSFDKHPTDLAMLAGARLVAANETEQGRSWAAERIKALTGGEFDLRAFHAAGLLRVRAQVQIAIRWQSRSEPGDGRRGHSTTIHRRAIRYQTEGEGHATRSRSYRPKPLKSCSGASTVAAIGLPTASWHPTRLCRRRQFYFDDQDLFTRWLEERVDRTDSTKTTTKEAALTSWNAFRAIAGERPEQAQDLAQRLRRAGFTEGRSRDRTNRKRVWHGMELRHDSLNQ